MANNSTDAAANKHNNLLTNNTCQSKHNLADSIVSTTGYKITMQTHLQSKTSRRVADARKLAKFTIHKEHGLNYPKKMTYIFNLYKHADRREFMHYDQEFYDKSGGASSAGIYGASTNSYSDTPDNEAKFNEYLESIHWFCSKN